MDKNLNLVEILKDCPKGFKLYSPLVGEVEFERILDDVVCPVVTWYNGRCLSFTNEGFYYDDAGAEAECLLFPSAGQRDWSKFKVPWYKKKRFNPNTLKPFDKVLMRDDKVLTCWRCAFFSHKREEEITPYKYAAMYGSYKYCIPYNDDTKHLVGTTDEAPDYYCYWNN